jgi:hypothetical protein
VAEEGRLEAEKLTGLVEPDIKVVVTVVVAAKPGVILAEAGLTPMEKSKASLLAKSATTVLLEVIVKMQFPVPEHAPDHPEKVELESATADKVTFVP